MLSILLLSFTLLLLFIHLISIYLSETIKTVWAELVCFCSIIRTTPPCDTITVSQVPSPLLFILYFAETTWARLVRFYLIDEYLLPVIRSPFTGMPTVHNKKHSIHFNLIFYQLSFIIFMRLYTPIFYSLSFIMFVASYSWSERGVCKGRDSNLLYPPVSIWSALVMWHFLMYIYPVPGLWLGLTLYLVVFWSYILVKLCFVL